LSLRNAVVLGKAALESVEINRDATGRAFGCPTQILGRPGDRMAQLTGCSQRPVRIPQKLTGKNHQISLAISDDVVCLGSGCDHAHGCRGHSGLPPDTVGKGGLVAGPSWNRNSRETPAGRTDVRSWKRSYFPLVCSFSYGPGAHGAEALPFQGTNTIFPKAFASMIVR
jgi:hypothetical protein